MKSLVNSGTVETTIGINLEIVSKFRHYPKLPVVSILRSIVNLGTVENYKQLRPFFVVILQLWLVFILPPTKTIWNTLGALLTFFLASSTISAILFPIRRKQNTYVKLSPTGKQSPT
jgi:hypothetical protein